MRIFVYEFFSSGNAHTNTSLLAEGYAMLTSVLTDFARCPGVEPVTFVDPKLPLPNHLCASRLSTPVSPESFELEARLSDACLIIAPETGRVLEHLTITAENVSPLLLGSSSLGVRIAGNKFATLSFLSERGIPVPRTECIRSDADPQEVMDFGLPLVIKPVDGAGSAGASFVTAKAEIGRSLERARAASSHPAIILQEYVPGIAASVSCLVKPSEFTGGPRCTPLSLNRQMVVTDGSHMTYRGVRVPLRHPLTRDALDLGTRACTSIPGLRGWVGVDMILSEPGPVVIEVNPRLTDSYIALRKITPANLASLLVDVCSSNSEVSPPPVVGEAEYVVEGLSWQT